MGFSSNKYLALLRGINVGGNNKVPMKELKKCFEALSFKSVTTYINSGNVVFEAENTDEAALRQKIEAELKKVFGFSIVVVVIAAHKYRRILQAAPIWWGKNSEWKHNIIFFTRDITENEALDAIGTLKPEIEAVAFYHGAIFQSLSFAQFGKTTSGKIAGKAIYKQMTIRNYNTAQKLRALLSA